MSHHFFNFFVYKENENIQNRNVKKTFKLILYAFISLIISVIIPYAFLFFGKDCLNNNEFFMLCLIPFVIVYFVICVALIYFLLKKMVKMFSDVIFLFLIF